MTNENIKLTPQQERSQAVERLPRDSAYWQRVRKRLTKLLKRNSGSFWAQYFEAVYSPSENVRVGLRDLLAVNPNPTIGDLRADL